jgi:hypothetical protein
MFSNPRGSYHSMSWQAVRESASFPKEVKDVLAMFAPTLMRLTGKPFRAFHG